MLEQTQSLSYQLRPRLLLLADYVQRENRVGQLNWARFRESPLDTSLTHDLTAGLRQSWAGPRGSTSLRVGYRLLEQRNYSRAALTPDDPAAPASVLIYLRNINRQQGPEAAIERRATAGLLLSASLWLQWLRTYYAYQPGPGPYNGTSYTPAELAYQVRRVVPYFEVNVEWQLGQRR